MLNMMTNNERETLLDIVARTSTDDSGCQRGCHIEAEEELLAYIDSLLEKAAAKGYELGLQQANLAKE